MSPDPAPPRPPVARSASQVTAEPVTWLWPSRLALGHLALLDGDPDQGKSLVTLDLCARLSTGRPWPDGTPLEAPGSAIVISAEDSDPQTVCPRLQAMGADPGRVFFLPLDEAGGIDFRLPSRPAALDAVLAETGARLVVIDPISAFLDAGVNTHSDGGVRRALAPLAALARKYRCAPLLVRHLTKDGRHRALYRGLGSIGLIGSCRSAWLIAADPRVPDRRVLAQEKNNLAAPQPSLAFEVADAGNDLPALSWLGPCDWKADALLAAAGARPASPRPIDYAKEFLSELLRDGPRTTHEIRDKAEPLGLTKPTLNRARKALRLRTRRLFVDGKPTCYWMLRHHRLPPGVAPAGDDGIDEELRRLEEEWGQLRDPLDEEDEED
jgi:hypothetical protein